MFVGLVQDGAYSRGPLELLTDASSSSREYFNAYTCKVEQVLSLCTALQCSCVKRSDQKKSVKCYENILLSFV